MSLHGSTVAPRPFLEERSGLPDRQPLADFEDGGALARAIVDTIREPLLILDGDLCVVDASRSFSMTFKMDSRHLQGLPVSALGDGEWNIPELRSLLETIVSQDTRIEDYEVERDFSGIGRRTMLLNARKMLYQGNSRARLLLAFEDITARRAAEREMTALLTNQEVLLQEMQHRFANSLQIIAGILLLKARTVQSEETRLHLHDAHQRVMSLAAMQRQLGESRHGALIELDPYLSRLCGTLASSMIGDCRPVALDVHVEGGTVSSSEAVSIGLIVTELVINALKHAFLPGQRDGRVIVAYGLCGSSWRLTVSDNGIGKPNGHLSRTNPGLGTSITEALARQLDARVDVLMDLNGTMVSITHAALT